MNRKLAAIPLMMLWFFLCQCEKGVQTNQLFLDSLSHHTFNFFWDLADSVTGNQPDRWPTKSFSSIAATGFGLTSYLVGVNRGYISRAEAAQRVSKTLKFFWKSPK